MCVEATNVIIDQKSMKPLNVKQIGKKNILRKLKPSNAIITVLLERAPPSIKVGHN